ncbi:hypothetical protein [Vibrio coralliilyticus]|uniref:hypothetical protein n=1 Tax=Vibrio coralliilyticus TaxID=190893 RepID=UPI000C166E4B|nr:hypothetical protein [Vibrio coralliilyticus]
MKRIIFLIVILSISKFSFSTPLNWPKLNTTIYRAVNEMENKCSNYSIDTTSNEQFEFKDHHQSQAISPKWKNNNITISISHSETDSGDKGKFFFSTVKPENQNSEGVLVGDDEIYPVFSQETTEQHPSGITWFDKDLGSSDKVEYAYSVSANENSGIIQFREFDNGTPTGIIHDFKLDNFGSLTDIWFAIHDGAYYMIAHDMNHGIGNVYIIDPNAFQNNSTQLKSDFVNSLSKKSHRIGTVTTSSYISLKGSYTSPTDTGCGKSLGQNAELVMDSQENWYVVYSFTDSFACGDNMGNNVVKAYPASFDENGNFSIGGDATVTVEEWVGYSAGGTSRGADGAAGFKVTPSGVLVGLFGAQFSGLSNFDYRTTLELCHR